VRFDDASSEIEHVKVGSHSGCGGHACGRH
jgi:hypothetical protein